MVWRLYPLAIVLGGVMGSVVAALALALGSTIVTWGAATPFSEVTFEQPGFHIVLLASSIASSLCAGWVTARFAFGEELLNASVTGLLLVAFGAPGHADAPLNDLLDWGNVASFGLALPFSVIGGLLYRGRVSAVA